MIPLFFYKYFNLILLAFLVHIRLSTSAVVLPANQISLYNSADKIVVLDRQNFSSTIYHSNTAWLIEFYASWCGHCQSYANIYREIGIDTWAWKNIVRIGAINCYAGNNTPLCRAHHVRGYPTLQFIPPDTNFDNKSKAIVIPATDAIYVERELIKELENIKQKNKIWPRFIPVNRMTIEELYLHIPKTIKLRMIIAEKRDDFTGRQIMLDFSKYYNQIAIFRMTTDGKLWRNFHLNLTDVPALFVILRNRTIERLNFPQNMSTRNAFHYAIRTYIHEKNLIENFTNQHLEEIIQSKNALKTTQIKQEFKKNQNLSDEIRDKHTIYRKVHMIDLELALFHMFQHDIPQIKDIQGEIYNALIQWLTVLIKYFPGREPVMNYLKYLLLKINEQPNGLTGDKFREIINMKTSDAYLPNYNGQYQHCAGSAPRYRGYPCSLWLLFHTLTVSQYEKQLNAINVMEIPIAIKNYIKYFFTCRKCSENFMKETMDINQLNLTNKYEAIIYLWKIHNHVNKRLRNDITEDPDHPKVQFPSKRLCSTCQLDHNYDILKTIDFLIVYYSKENIETTKLLNQSENIDLKFEFIPDKTVHHEFLRTIFQRYTPYVFIFLLIIIILFRRRYCKTKRQRYTV